MKAMVRRLVKWFIGASTAVLLVLAGYRIDWSGFANKTLWDWMDLALIPAALALLAWWFSQRDKKREAGTKALELQLAKENREEEILQAYLDRMQTLLLEKNLLVAQKTNVVATVARELTLITLKRLSPTRKSAVVGFLSSARLIQSKEGKPGIISLMGADLEGLGAPFGVGMMNLVGVELFGANLSGAKLDVPNLQGADLRGAVFEGTQLAWPDLRGANLQGALLHGANIFEPVLDEDTILPNGKRWTGTDLTEFGVANISPFTKEEMSQVRRELNMEAN